MNSPRASAVVGAFPLRLFSADAAAVVTLQPGAYTVQVSGADRSVSGPVGSSDAGGATGSMSAVAAAAAAGAVVATGTLLPAKPGVALLEIFELP